MSGLGQIQNASVFTANALVRFAIWSNLHSHNGRIGDVVEDALEVAGSPLVTNSQVDVAGRVQLTGCVVILKEEDEIYRKTNYHFDFHLMKHEIRLQIFEKF